MKILFDEGVPLPLARHFPEEAVVDAVKSLGWGSKSDNEILQLAEKEGYDVLVTTDKGIVHQQNLTKLKVQVYMLPTTSWPKLRNQTGKIVRDIERLISNRHRITENPIDE